MYSDSYYYAKVCINTGASHDDPQFTVQDFLTFNKQNHAMYAGGGDWNEDGIEDYLFMQYGGSNFILYEGFEMGSEGLQFTSPFDAGVDLGISGVKPKSCAFMWDYSGTSAARNVYEFIGIGDRDAGDHQTINFFEADRTTGDSTLVKSLYTPPAQGVCLVVKDFNLDGMHDILFGCGTWNSEDVYTKIYVMYAQ